MPEMSLIDDERIENDAGSHRPEDGAELPRRPRRKLLAPVPVALLAVLTAACGFIAGVQVQKGQQSSSSGVGARAAVGIAALRGARGATAAGGASGARGANGTAFGATGGPGAGAAGAGGAGAGAGTGATVGEVANVDGKTLYVTDSQGNTVKVAVPTGLKVSKTVSTSAHNIHPGETVIVQGATNSDGSIEARSISIGSAGGLGALFGARGAGGGRAAAGGGSSAGAGGAGAPTVLFGG